MGASAIGAVPAGGAGAVSSVAGRTGAVVLTAADVGAGQLPSGVILPDGAVTAAKLDAAVAALRPRVGGPFSGYSYDPRSGLAGAVWPSASRGFFVRPQGVKKAGCTKLVVAPLIASGNLNVAVYGTSGSGLSAVPSGNARVSSGSTAVGTANQFQEITITATDIDPDNDWLFMIVDNGTASFCRVTLANAAFGNGLLYSYTGSGVVVPSSGFSTGANGTYLPWIGYE